MKTTFLTVVLCLLFPFSSHAQQITKELNLHIDQPERPFSLTFSRGATEGVRVHLYQGGVKLTGTVFDSGSFFYSSNAYSAAGAIITNTSSGNGFIDFFLNSTDTLGLSTNVTDFPETNFAQVAVSDGTNTYDWDQGTAKVRPSPFTSGAGAVSQGSILNWANFSEYQNTAASGPYRAGTNVTFTANADGSLDVNASISGGSGTVQFGSNGLENVTASTLGLDAASQASLALADSALQNSTDILHNITITPQGTNTSTVASDDDGWYNLFDVRGIKFSYGGTAAQELTADSNSNLMWYYDAIWHEGNDGAGSGLNADLLDGQHASAFVTSTNPIDANLYGPLASENAWTSTQTVNAANGNGVSGAPDAIIGDGTYGNLKVGDSEFYQGDVSGRSGTMILKNNANPEGGSPGWEFAVIESGNTIRFALPESAAGYGTWNPRSLIVGGPYVSTGGVAMSYAPYWGMTNADYNTSSTGPDVGILDDLEVLGMIYAAGEGITLPDGTVLADSDDVGGGGGSGDIYETIPAANLSLAISSPGSWSVITNGSGVAIWTLACDDEAMEGGRFGETFTYTNYSLAITTLGASNTGTVQFAAQEVGGAIVTSGVYAVGTTASTVWWSNLNVAASITPTWVDLYRHPSNATAEVTGDVLIQSILLQQEAP